MAKSLKNFITIRQALEVNTPRQIRFCFLLHKYNSPMDYGDGSLTQAVSIDKLFNEYFHNIKALLRRYGGKGGSLGSGHQHKGTREDILYNALETAKTAIRGALLDDFDTPRAISLLLELIKDSNKYVEVDEMNLSTIAMTCVAQYITKMLSLFGLVQDAYNTGIGFGSWGNTTISMTKNNTTTDTTSNSTINANESGSGSINTEQLLTPFLDVLTKFRETVRIAAITGDSNTNQTILQAADLLRDEILPTLGVRMEDKGSGKDVVTVWKLEHPEVLLKEKQQKEEMKLIKLKQKEEAAKKLKEKEEKSKQNPSEMFLNMTDLYTNFDSITGKYNSL